MRVERRINEVVNRLERTKTEVKKPDLRAQREERDQKERDVQKEKMREDKRVEKELEERKKKDSELRFYGRLLFVVFVFIYL